jgi:hypothetical protein
VNMMRKLIVSRLKKSSRKYPQRNPGKTKGVSIAANPLFYLARPKRFELLTPWFVAKYSIQLSYGRVGRNYTGLASTIKGKPQMSAASALSTPPSGALRGIFKQDAVVGQFLADTVCLGKVSGFFCVGAIGDQFLNSRCTECLF